jgi:predicted nucleic acid-binding Zn ribbon protein
MSPCRYCGFEVPWDHRYCARCGRVTDRPVAVPPGAEADMPMPGPRRARSAALFWFLCAILLLLVLPLVWSWASTL